MEQERSWLDAYPALCNEEPCIPPLAISRRTPPDLRQLRKVFGRRGKLGIEGTGSTAPCRACYRSCSQLASRGKNVEREALFQGVARESLGLHQEASDQFLIQLPIVFEGQRSLRDRKWLSVGWA